MVKVSRDFQVFVKPAGSTCNLACDYCYYLEKEQLYPENESLRMPDDILEEYIIQHIDASPGPVIGFSWHGGEPTVLGIDYFRKIVSLQRKHESPKQRITNGIQTNGTLINEEWCHFLAAESFAVGLSLDGPQEMHDRYRITRNRKPTYEQVIRGYELLHKHQINTDILCVVNDYNVQFPAEVYRFFKEVEARYITFLPLVEEQPDAEGGVSSRTVPAEAWGDFLRTIFDEWKSEDIGRTKVQIFEEAARTAFGQEHSLCIFRKTCGDIPVIEHNGDFFSCDHFVDAEHYIGNIGETPLIELLESPFQRAFGQAKSDTLPRFCRECDVRDMCNGGCPKNRLNKTPDGEAGLNYLCKGYKRFFTHCRSFVKEIAALWKHQSSKQQVQTSETPAIQKTGRNDPCPCGSGKKYKQCCLRK